MDKTVLKAYMLGLLACVIWGGNFVVARAVHAEIPPMTLSFGRWLVAWVVIVFISAPHLKKDWPVIRKNFRLLIPIGMLGVGGFNTLVYHAAHTTTAHNIAIIAATSPIWILLMVSCFKQEELSPAQIVGTLVALCGALLVIARGDLQLLSNITFVRGDVYVLIASLIWASYCVLLKYKPESIHPASFLMAIITIGVITLFPLYVYELYQKGGIALSYNTVWVFLYVGVGTSVIAWYAWNHATYVLGAARASVIYYSLPLFSAVVAVFWLGEALYWYHSVAFLLVVSGIQISRYKRT